MAHVRLLFLRAVEASIILRNDRARLLLDAAVPRPAVDVTVDVTEGAQTLGEILVALHLLGDQLLHHLREAELPSRRPAANSNTAWRKPTQHPVTFSDNGVMLQLNEHKPAQLPRR
jgi:hypothetical protein